MSSEALIPPAWRTFLLSALALLPVGLLVFFWSSTFFTAWDGQAISVAPPRSESVQEWLVRIQQADGTVQTAWWPVEVARPLNLPVDVLGLATPTLPEQSATTRKSRFALQFDVQLDKGTAQERTVSVPTAKPRDIGLGLLVWVLVLGLRNMIVAGSPVALVRADSGVEGERPEGKVLDYSRRSATRSRPGPPPPGPRKGRGRR